MQALAGSQRVDHYLAWLGGSAAWSAVVAWLAFQVQQEGIAPAVLFPLLTGALLGAGLAVLTRLTGVPGLRAAWVAAVVWGLMVVIGQDYIGHRHRARLYDETLSRQQSPFAVLAAGDERMRPDFSHYLAGKVRGDPAWWGLDLALTAAAAVAVTALGATRQQLPTSDT